MNPKTTPLATTIAAAALSTGTLFALQAHADASIIYSSVNLTVGPIFGSNANSAKGMSIGGYGFSLFVDHFARLRNTAAGVGVASNQLSLVKNNTAGAQKLAAGAVISAARHFASTNGNFAIFRDGVRSTGTWSKDQVGYAGVQLPNGDLGWMRLVWTSTDGTGLPNELTVLDDAYDTTPGETILAGQTSSVPEPGTGALLALAGAGAAFLRRRRAARP